jgi:hypothetical protein
MAFRKQAMKWRARIPDWVDLAFDAFKANMVRVNVLEIVNMFTELCLAYQ